MKTKALQPKKVLSKVLCVLLLSAVSMTNANAQTGALNGLFTINENGDQVRFSQGNLQYQASTHTWRFAENQWDYVGEDNANISETYDGWIDLFGWGTSGYNHGAEIYQPWDSWCNIYAYSAYGEMQYNLYDQTGQADWGYNPISNGGNVENCGWRTLRQQEWEFVFNERNTASGIRFAKVIMNGVKGVVLLPDNWLASIYSFSNVNVLESDFESNIISFDDWMSNFVARGAVFLPVTGWRVNDTEMWLLDYGFYWTSTVYTDGDGEAKSVSFGDENWFSDSNDLSFRSERCEGCAVRLVRPVEPATHGYIDLGLPSGTLWATCNVGADAPEEYGDYFAWGETQPKDYYDWNNYLYCNGYFNQLTKYCNDSNYGYNDYTDDLSTLLPEDDAATANWGNEWHMPNDEEWQELYDNTNYMWTTQNGVYGNLFTASNGNTLFLPAAGYREGSGHNEADYQGYYWSNKLCTFDPIMAWAHDFGVGYGGGYRFRDHGYTVRPVRSSSQEMSFTINATAIPEMGGEVSGGGTYAEGTTCTLTATANEGYTFTNWIENGVVVSTEATYSFTVTGDRNLVANFAVSGSGNHAYVDLGLPSGTLWATCNVGADAPEEYGDYFAWGETTPKDDYSWSTYQYCMGSENTLTKYCGDSEYGYNGFTDNLTTLLSEDDAATANWGNNWRMPTKAEFEELFNNTTVTWTQQNGVYGRLFTASNGNSLFLPAAGHLSNDVLNSSGTEGYYWSNSLNTDSPYNSWGIYFLSSYCNMAGSSRELGRSVRPVRSAEQSSACSITFDLDDSCGDSWNGNYLVVSYGDITEQLTVESGSSASYSLQIPDGSHVDLSWIPDSWIEECSFTVNYENGNVIYQGFDLYDDFSYEFDIDCEEMPATTFDITASAVPEEGGTIEDTGEYDCGTECTLTAIPNEGYVFLNWTENGEVVSTDASYSFIVNGNRDLVANFLSISQLLASISDDFNDGVINFDYWTAAGPDIFEEDGMIKMQQNEIDAYVALESLPMRIPSNNQIVIERSFLVHEQLYGGDHYYYGSFTIRFNGSEDNLIGICYYDDDYENRHGTYLINKQDGEATETRICDATFDTWLEEKVVVDLSNETLSYYLSDTLVATLSIEGVSNQQMDYFTVWFNPYGWWTGHYHNMDYVNINTPSSDFYTIQAAADPEEGGITIVGMSISEFFDFEDQQIPSNWTNDTIYPWVITTSEYVGYNGSFCMMSGNGGIHSSTSSIEVTVDFVEDGTISFLAGCWGEGTSYVWDKCIFSIDNVAQFTCGALQSWNSYSYGVSAGTHTFRWSYSKDSSVHPTGDAFFVDDVQFTGVFDSNPYYYYGQTCTMVAVPNEGYNFVEWTKDGTPVSTDAIYTITVTENADYVAHFQLQSFTITAEADPTGGGTVLGAGEYDYNTTCTLTATPNEGYLFLNWTKNGEVVSCNATYSFTVTEDADFEAVFMLLEGTLIGSGEQTEPRLPSYSYFNYTLSQQIYTPEEIEASGGITTISYFNTGETKTRSYDIYMVHTDKLTFESNTDWIIVSEADRVFSGEVTLTRGYWTPIVLDAPFAYDGTSNLAIIIDDNSGNWTESPHMACRVFNTNGNQAIFVYSDNPNYDPYNPSEYNGTRYSEKNQVIFEILPFYHFVTPGTWGNASNWSNGALPRANNVVFIDAPCQLDQDATVAALTVTEDQSLTLQSGKTLTVTNTLINPATTGLVIEDGAQLLHASENVSATVKKNIAGHGTGIGKYRLISNPLASAINPELASVYHITKGNYDFYDWLATAPDHLEWRNFKDDSFMMSPEGCGYLYANQNGMELLFPGVLKPSHNRYAKAVSYDSSDTEHPGWNLIGNPFVCNAYLVDENNEPLPYYRMNAAGDGFEAVTPGTAIAPMEGVFYRASGNGTVYFIRTDYIPQLQYPIGAINGKFTINDNGDQVYFSQGNLQYQAFTNTWKFAENQYDYVGGDNSNISSTYSGWIDLFGWGTSGYNHGAVCYQPWSTDQTTSYYYAYGNATYNLNDQTGQADWGYNPISNGGNTANRWRTLTRPEWDYVFNTRATSSGIRYAKANVNNVNGVILLPDNWSSSTYSLNDTNSSGASFSSNTLTASQWNIMEQAGAIFLPAAGSRYGTTVHSFVGGSYWTASYSNSYSAYHVGFYDSGLYMSDISRSCGFSVRLVCPIEN